MLVQTAFSQFLETYSLIGTKNKWLVAVSGGVDSVVLCHLCANNHIPFAMAHCNFNLRGEESINDQKFVTELAENLGVEIFVETFDTMAYQAETGKSVQVAARELRYDWFEKLLKENVAFTTQSLLATAHHAGDNIETVMMNLFRGTGIKGLRGILPYQKKTIRPLLQVSKNELINYAKTHKYKWVEDSSNSSDKYTRNLIRNQVLPLMEQAIPRAEMGYEKTIEAMAEAEILYNQAIAIHKKKLMVVVGHETSIPVLKLAASQPLKSIVYEIIKEYGFTALQTAEVIDLLKSHSGRFVSSPSHRIIKNRAWLIIAPLNTEAAHFILLQKTVTNLTFEQGRLHLKSFLLNPHISICKDANMAMVNAAKLQYPLILRPWKMGDYFYPLGMLKKKKLSRFFIDIKLSKTEKEKVWVVESNKKVVWVVGLRIDERFKITTQTKEVVEISFKKK